MGKSLPSPTRLQAFSRIITSNRLQRPKNFKPASKTLVVPLPEPLKTETVIHAESEPHQLGVKTMEHNSQQQQSRMALAEVVSDCVSRWFQDTLKEAKAGDTAMQVLVGQMYYSGYGVTRDAQKGRAWINRASKSRSSVWQVSDKRPGYNASDSDSEDKKAETQRD